VPRLRRRLLPTALVAALSLAGAAAVAGCTPAAGAATDHSGPSVVTAFYPLAYVARRVGGPDVAVTDLVKAGTEPHDVELNPRQAREVATADLVVYLRGFQPATDDAVAAGVSGRVLDVAGLTPARRDPTGSGTDPHVWLDPVRMRTIAAAVTGALVRLDPAHADGYRTRGAALAADLTALDRAYADGLRTCARHEIVTSHAAFGYLADRYHLTQVAIAGVTPDSEPTPRRLAAAIDAARRSGARTIFFERLVSPRVADTVAEAAGARARALDPIESLAPGSHDDYLTLMRANLAALHDALECR
jgi:zinc transport system substrate-binding protein